VSGFKVLSAKLAANDNRNQALSRL